MPDEKPINVDLTTPLTGYDGEELIEHDQVLPHGVTLKGQGKLTLAKVCAKALIAGSPNDKGNEIETLKDHKMATEIFQSKNMKFTVEELALIQKRIHEQYHRVVSGTALQLLEDAVRRNGDG